jgi:prepilin-type N-terminal cleavage/methylation domain-containing protein
MKTGFPSSRRAFTLIEVMIAITLFAVIVAAMYACWDAILRATRAGHVAAADAQRSRMALRALTDSLLSAEIYDANVRYYSFLADTSSDFASLSFVSRLPESFPGSGVFGYRPLRRITFTVESSERVGGENDLVMRQMPLLEVTNEDEQPYAIVLARRVQVFGLEFWDPQLGDWANQWIATNRLPPMVRITLAAGGSSSSKLRAADVATRVVLLSTFPIPIQYQIRPGLPMPPGAPGVPLRPFPTAPPNTR